MAKRSTFTRVLDRLRKKALSYPNTKEELPWGHPAFKVNGKIFLALNVHEGVLSLSTKLPESASLALGLPFASPTEYGLGKHGWVTCKFAADDEVPVEMLLDWLDESYRAVAPAKVLALLDGAAEPQSRKRVTKRR